MAESHQLAPNGRDAKGRFAPGWTGGGRPQGFRAFQEKCERFMDSEGWQLLLELARTEGPQQRFAIQLIAEYAYGRPQQHVDVTADSETIKAYVGVDIDRV